MVIYYRITLAALALVLTLTATSSRSHAQTGFEWMHWVVGNAIDPATSKTSLAIALDQIEAAGWDVRFVTPRSTNPYAATAVVYDVVARGPLGLYVPVAYVPPPPPPAPEPPPAVSTTITCPTDPHPACTVMPNGSYDRVWADLNFGK